MQPHITVVICTRDRPTELAACLAALSSQIYRCFDILVVDNASREPVRELCNKFGAAYWHEPVPGLSRARNAGAREAEGEIVAFTDDDAVPEAGWLEALAGAFSDPAIAAATGSIRYMKSRPGSRLITSEVVGRGDSLRRPADFDLNTPDWFTVASFGGIGDGGNMAFRRTLFAERTIRFDERLGRGRLVEGGDEHAIFASLIAGGYRIRCAPEATVLHPWPPTVALELDRRFADLRSAISYLLFLWFEFRAHRVDVARFVARALAKRILIARGSRSKSGPALKLPRRLAARAVLSGVSGYLRARLQWTREKTKETRARAAAQACASSFSRR